MKRLKNKLDEMQEQKLLKAESVGLHITAIGLGAAFLIQCAMGAAPAQCAGEFIVLELLCGYMAFSYLRIGVWDRFFAPSIKVQLVVSLVAGVIVGLVVFGIATHYGDTGMVVVKDILLASVSCFVLCFLGLTLFTRIYKKRREKLDKE